MLLDAHPTSPRLPVRRFDGDAQWQADGRLSLSWQLQADTGALLLPGPPNSHAAGDPASRQDNLWHHTCFEAFLLWDGGTAYREFNFAPDGRWAAYRFSGFRKEGGDLELPSPRQSTWQVQTNLVRLTAIVSPQAIAPPGAPPGIRTALHVGLTAVLESKAGQLAYWSLAHPVPEKPEFHHAGGFVLVPASAQGSRAT